MTNSNTTTQSSRLTALINNISLFQTINNPTNDEIEVVLEKDFHMLNIRLNKELYLNRDFSQSLKIKFIKILPKIILEIKELNEELILIAAKADIHILGNKKLIPYISEVSKMDLLRRIPITVCFFEDIPLEIQEMYLKRGTHYLRGIKNIHPSLFEKVIYRGLFPENLIQALNQTTDIKEIIKYSDINDKIIKELSLNEDMIMKLLAVKPDFAFYLPNISKNLIKEVVIANTEPVACKYNLVRLCANDIELMSLLLNKFPSEMIENYLRFLPVELTKNILLMRPDLFSSIKKKLNKNLDNTDLLNMINTYKKNSLTLSEKSLRLLLTNTIDIEEELRNWLICSILSLNANYIRFIKNPTIEMQNVAMVKNPNVASKIHNIDNSIIIKFNIDLVKAAANRFEAACMKDINILNNRQNLSEEEITFIQTLSFEVLSKLTINYLTPKVVVERISVLINS